MRWSGASTAESYWHERVRSITTLIVALRCGRTQERSIRFFPRRQQLDQRPKDDERQDCENDCDQQTFTGDESHLVSRVAEEALGEELTSDHHVPAHGENA